MFMYVLPQICIGRKHHKELQKEFLPHISRQSIYNALSYRNNSEIALKVRMKAKELLLREIKEIEKYEKVDLENSEDDSMKDQKKEEYKPNSNLIIPFLKDY